MHHLRRYRWYLFLFLGILVAGFAVSWFLLPHISDQWTLTRNQQRWTTAQLTHYRYILEPVCFCPPDDTRPVTIEVTNGTVNSIRYLDDGTAAKPDIFDKYATIDKLFALLQDALDQPDSRLNISYDPQLGYPSKAAIDYLPNAIDDEFYFRVRNVEAIK
jgi:hypothetical protein